MKKTLLWMLSLLALTTASPAMAASATDALAPIVSLIVSIGYLIGLILCIAGIYGFRKHAENPQQYTISYCIMNITAGTMLLLSSMIYSVLKRSSIDPDWAHDNSSLAIDKHAMEDVSTVSNSFIGQYIPAQTALMLIGFIYIVGLIAFLKGIFMLKNVGQVNGGQEGGVGKALTHMFGGLVCMNIVQFSCIIGNTLGISMMCIGG